MIAHASGEFVLGGDMPVFRMGFGAMRITGEGVWGPPADRAGALAVLRRSLELGITLIDTADAYGPFISEELIAEALYPYPEGLILATKGGLVRTGPGQWQPNGRPEHLRATCEASLKRLRQERIDLYQLHRIDPAVPADDQFGTLQDLQREGKIRHIGLSEVSVADIEHAQTYFPVVSVQNLYNLGDRRHEEVLQYCATHHIGFIPWYPLAAGKKARAGETGLEDIARELRATPSQVALAWLLHHSPVMLPIPGTSKVAHLEENTAASTLSLPTDLYEALTAMR